MEKDQKFQLRHSKAWIAAIDRWRFKQAVKREKSVSKAEAIRELADSGLRAANDIQEAWDDGYLVGKEGGG